MRKGKRNYCIESSTMYNSLRKEKHNGKILFNGDMRVGNTMAVCSKTDMLYKLS